MKEAAAAATTTTTTTRVQTKTRTSQPYTSPIYRLSVSTNDTRINVLTALPLLRNTQNIFNSDWLAHSGAPLIPVRDYRKILHTFCSALCHCWLAGWLAVRARATLSALSYKLQRLYNGTSKFLMGRSGAGYSTRGIYIDVWMGKLWKFYGAFSWCAFRMRVNFLGFLFLAMRRCWTSSHHEWLAIFLCSVCGEFYSRLRNGASFSFGFRRFGRIL